MIDTQIWKDAKQTVFLEGKIDVGKGSKKFNSPGIEARNENPPIKLGGHPFEGRKKNRESQQRKD